MVIKKIQATKYVELKLHPEIYMPEIYMAANFEELIRDINYIHNW